MGPQLRRKRLAGVGCQQGPGGQGGRARHRLRHLGRVALHGGARHAVLPHDAVGRLGQPGRQPGRRQRPRHVHVRGHRPGHRQRDRHRGYRPAVHPHAV